VGRVVIGDAVLIAVGRDDGEGLVPCCRSAEAPGGVPRAVVQAGRVRAASSASWAVFASHLLGDQDMGGVDGAALGAVDGGGVEQLHPIGDVLGRQPHPAPVGLVLDGQ
jgi:hypothetical protein